MEDWFLQKDPLHYPSTDGREKTMKDKSEWDRDTHFITQRVGRRHPRGQVFEREVRLLDSVVKGKFRRQLTERAIASIDKHIAHQQLLLDARHAKQGSSEEEEERELFTLSDEEYDELFEQWYAKHKRTLFEKTLPSLVTKRKYTFTRDDFQTYNDLLYRVGTYTETPLVSMMTGFVPSSALGLCMSPYYRVACDSFYTHFYELRRGFWAGHGLMYHLSQASPSYFSQRDDGRVSQVFIPNSEINVELIRYLMLTNHTLKAEDMVQLSLAQYIMDDEQNKFFEKLLQTPLSLSNDELGSSKEDGEQVERILMTLASNLELDITYKTSVEKMWKPSRDVVFDQDNLKNRDPLQQVRNHQVQPFSSHSFYAMRDVFSRAHTSAVDMVECLYEDSKANPWAERALASLMKLHPMVVVLVFKASLCYEHTLPILPELRTPASKGLTFHQALNLDADLSSFLWNHDKYPFLVEDGKEEEENKVRAYVERVRVVEEEGGFEHLF
jgi:enoyl-CoA hydratase/carnithine racemase